MRGRGNVCREEIFDESLPKDVGWVADNAEDRELEHGVEVERKRRLSDADQQAGPQRSMQVYAHAILICRKSLSEDVRRYAEDRALQRLR